jgi:tetratricopeptide (TPR) repeat protein
MNLVFLFLFSLVLVSCAGKSTFSITSDPPGAQVYFRPMNSTERTEVGATPLILSSKDLKAKNVKSGPMMIELELDEYHTGKIIVTDIVGLDFNTMVPLTPVDALKMSRKFDQVSSKVIEVQRYIQSQNFDKALEITRDLIATFPDMSTPDEMEGTILYLTGDLAGALDSFSKAYSKNPRNTYALRMREVIRQGANRNN